MGSSSITSMIVFAGTTLMSAHAVENRTVLMKTSLELDSATVYLPSADKSLVIPMGNDILLDAAIENRGTHDLVIEDPKSTQLILVYFKSPQDKSETTFLLNP